jgi:hypothetical protein
MSTLLDEDKQGIRRWLGYPLNAQWLQKIEVRAAEINALGAPSVAEVQRLIRELNRIHTEMLTQRPFMDRTLTSNAGGTNQRSPSFAKEYYTQQIRDLVDELASATQLAVYRYPTGSGWGSGGRLRRA